MSYGKLLIVILKNVQQHLIAYMQIKTRKYGWDKYGKQNGLQLATVSERGVFYFCISSIYIQNISYERLNWIQMKNLNAIQEDT